MPQKLKTLSMEMRRRLAEGSPELRQSYMKLLLEAATVDHHSIRLEGLQCRLPKFSLLFGSGVPEWSKERTGAQPSGDPNLELNAP